MIWSLDFGIRAVVLLAWIFVDQSRPKRPAGERPDTYRRQGSLENPDPLPRADQRPARPGRVRHQRDRRVGAHLPDGRLARRRTAALADAGEPSLATQVP